jgi:hypothetical protein
MNGILGGVECSAKGSTTYHCTKTVGKTLLDLQTRRDIVSGNVFRDIKSILTASTAPPSKNSPAEETRDRSLMSRLKTRYCKKWERMSTKYIPGNVEQFTKGSATGDGAEPIDKTLLDLQAKLSL